MEIFQTNAALGYNQLAYLIRLDKSENGYNYLCIDTKNVKDDDFYEIGQTVSLGDYCIEKTDYKLTDSPLNNSFLFNLFLNTLKVKQRLNHLTYIHDKSLIEIDSITDKNARILQWSAINEYKSRLDEVKDIVNVLSGLKSAF